MTQQWDVLVIGAGIAGLAAAGAAAAAGLSCACIDRLGPGGTAMNLSRLHDHPDAPDIGGADLIAQLMETASDAGVEMLFGEVQSIAGGAPWTVRADAEAHTARAVIVATGLSAGSLGVPDEESFEGRGLSHCAACDGPLFAGQSVAVVGNDRWTAQEALELTEIAARVTLIGADAGGAPSVTVFPGRVVALEGADGLEAIVVEHDGKRDKVQAQGLFAYQDRRPQLDFAGALIPTGTDGRATVDDDLRTRVPLILAVGDVRAGSAETVAGAVADGKRAGQVLAGLLKG